MMVGVMLCLIVTTTNSSAIPIQPARERMWRDDNLYDIVIVVGHNDLPRMQGGGSAIFIHVAGVGDSGLQATEGCIALCPGDLRLLVSKIGPQTRLHIG